ncbi:MAG: HD-GYP domain-containing protein [Candidatus Zixiibacteriota bacterium]
MEKIGIISESNMLWSGLKAAASKRGLTIFRTPLDELRKQAKDKNLPDVLLIDFPKRNQTYEDILEGFCIENPEVLVIILGDKVESTFLKSYSYLVAPRIVNYAFIMDIVVNTLAYKSLLLKESQRHQKVIDFDKKKNISNAQRHKELLIARNGELLIQRERLQRERENFHNSMGEVIEFLMQMIEYQSPEIAGHSRYVAKLANRIGINLDMNGDELRYLEWAALLHDIGKLEKYEVSGNADSIKRHAVVGEALLSRVELLRPLSRIVRSHHERFDGTGLPDKIHGDEIPLESRIIAICNTIAMIDHDGKYENDSKIAKDLIIKSGFSLDPELVEIMLENIGNNKVTDEDEFMTIRPQELEEGMQLYDDLYTSHGLFLIPSGEVLTEEQIKRIQSFHRIAPVIGGVKIMKDNIEFERSNGGRKQA